MESWGKGVCWGCLHSCCTNTMMHLLEKGRLLAVLERLLREPSRATIPPGSSWRRQCRISLGDSERKEGTSAQSESWGRTDWRRSGSGWNWGLDKRKWSFPSLPVLLTDHALSWVNSFSSLHICFCPFVFTLMQHISCSSDVCGPWPESVTNSHSQLQISFRYSEEKEKSCSRKFFWPLSLINLYHHFFYSHRFKKQGNSSSCL